jgi:RNA polymerase sigma-70 factor (ECF subfamily)
MDDERRERFRALYVSARPRILAYALRRAHNTEDAADVVAETLAIAWKRLEQVPEGDGALLWLYVTARHVLANQSRRARRRSDLVARIGSVLASHETLVTPTDEAALVALAVLRDLGEEDREVLMLSGWEGLDAASVGQVLGCSPAAAPDPPPPCEKAARGEDRRPSGRETSRETSGGRPT